MKLEFTSEELNIINRCAECRVSNRMEGLEEYSAENENAIKFYSTFGKNNVLANFICALIMNYYEANFEATKATFKLRESIDTLYEILGDEVYHACPGSCSSPIGRYFNALGWDIQERLASLELKLQDNNYIQSIYNGDKDTITYLLKDLQHIVKPDVPRWLKTNSKINKENKDEH